MTSYKIRQFKKGDFEGLMSLVKKCYGENAEPKEWWHWRYFEYPSASTKIMLAENNGKIVGIRPISFFSYSFEGRPIKGALFSAVMIHPKHRRKGLFTKLVSASVEYAFSNGAAFVNTMPNDLSYLGFMKLGWIDIGKRSLLFRPLDIGVLSHRFLPKYFGETLSSYIQPTFNYFLSKLVKEHYMVTVVEKFDKEAEDLSFGLASEYSGLVLLRPNVWWTWRFASHPWNNYKLYEARDKNGCLKGVAVSNKEKREGLEVGYLVDILGKTRSVRVQLANEVARQLSKEGVSLCLTVLSDRDLISDLLFAGYLTIPERFSPKKFHTVFLPRSDMEQEFLSVKNVSKWYLTLGDWDGI